MLLVCFILCLATLGKTDSNEKSINALGTGKLKDKIEPERKENVRANKTESNENDTVDYDFVEDVKIPWDKFVELLVKTSAEQLINAKDNINQFYRLTESEMTSIENSFGNSSQEYEIMLHHNLRSLIDSKKFNESAEFQHDFLDLSNYLVEQIIGLNLAKVNGQLLTPTKWYKQIMRQKILRQQSKIVTNYVEAHICAELSLCKDRWFYTEYLVEWLRHILQVNSFNLQYMFSLIPGILEKHVHTIKTNIKFKKTIKFIVNSNDIVQRDTIDYLDEVITNQKNVFNIVPTVLKKGATILVDLFKVIDDNYDLNRNNEEQLETISSMIVDWMQGENASVQEVLEAILSNMEINLKIWPLDQQRKVDLIWSKITAL